MTLDDFEVGVQDLLEQILNHLQVANLLANRNMPQAQNEILVTGKLVQDLGYLIEEYIAQQRQASED
jgi:hypothetical protein